MAGEEAPKATVDTLFEANKLAWRAVRWANAPLRVRSHRAPVAVIWTDAGWTTRPDGTSQGGHLVFIADVELLQGRESNMTLVSRHSGKPGRAAQSSSSAETQGEIAFVLLVFLAGLFLSTYVIGNIGVLLQLIDGGVRLRLDGELEQLEVGRAALVVRG